MTETIGKYEVEAVLGRGSQGTTYRARGLDGAPVAVKLYEPGGSEMARGEARLLEVLDHPGIPRLVDMLEVAEGDGTRVALVQEFVEGRSLQELIDDETFLSEAQIVDLARQLLGLASHLHDRESPILHRDIKPANIIFGEDGRLRLVDFGGGLAVQETGEVIGTAGYSAPEQYFGQSEPRSDLYSIGATLLAITTRKHPSEFPVRNLRYDLDSRLSCGAALKRLIQTLLEPEIARRPADAYAAALLLEAPPDARFDRIHIRRSPGALTVEVLPTYRRFTILAATSLLAGLGWTFLPGSDWLEGIAVGLSLLLLVSAIEFPKLRRERLTLSDESWSLRRTLGITVERSGALEPGFDLLGGARWNYLCTYEEMIAPRFAALVGERSVARARAAIRAFLDQRDGRVVLDLADHGDDEGRESAREEIKVDVTPAGSSDRSVALEVESPTVERAIVLSEVVLRDDRPCAIAGLTGEDAE